MTSTVFVDQQTVVPAAWLNDVNTGIYTILGAGGAVPATIPIARANLGVNGKLAFINITDYPYLADNTGSTDATSIITAAIAALAAAGGGVLFFPRGRYKYSTFLVDSGYITLMGEGPYASVLECNSVNGGVVFSGSSLPLCGVVSLGFAQTVNSTTATSALLKTVGVFRFLVHDCFFNGFSGGSSYAHQLLSLSGTSVYLSNINGSGGKTNGLYIEAGNDYIIQGATINLSAVTGRPLYIKDVTAGSLELSNCNFLEGANCLISNSNIGRFNSVFFDSAQGGLAVSGCEDLDFIGCEFANRVTTGSGDGTGVVFGNSKNCKLIGGAVINCGTDGVQIAADTVGIQLIGVNIDGNNTSDTAGKAGVQVAAGAQAFRIIGGRSGNNTALWTGHQKYGIAVAAGGSNNYLIDGVDVRNNDTLGLVDNGTGTAARVINNTGYNPVAAVSGAAGASPYTYTAGHAPETVYITGGTVSLVTVEGVAIYTSTDKTVHLGPNKSVVITHAGAPTVTRVPE